MQRLLLSGALIAILANLLVLGAYLWSRDGQRTVVDIERVNGAFRIQTDDEGVMPNVSDDTAFVAIDSPPQGTVILILPVAASSLPRPSGVDSVVIRDPRGNILFEDDFEFFDPSKWQIVSGDFEVNDGVLSAAGISSDNTLQVTERLFGDSKVSVTYRNSRGGSIGTHVTEDGGAYYHFDLHRDFPNFIDVFRDGQRTATHYGGFIRTTPPQTLRSIANMVTKPYPYILGALAAGFLLTFLMSDAGSQLRGTAGGRSGLQTYANWRGGIRLPERAAFLRRLHPATYLVLILAIVVFFVTRHINANYYGEIPHVPDEVSYIFGAKLLAAGKVMVEQPPLHDLFYFYWPNFLYERGDLWGSPYPFGHPLTLAIGQVFGSLPLMPSVVGAVSVVALFLVGKQMYGVRVGFMATLLLAASPFFLMQSSSFMSHTTCAMYTLLSLLFILKRERPLPYGVLAGIFFGLALNTRTLDLIVLIPPFALLLLSYAVEKQGRREALMHVGGFIAGGVLMAIAMGLYTYGLTGEPFGSTYAQGNTSELLGFKNGHTLDIGIRNEQAQMIALIQVFNGWPAYVGLAFVLAPFLLGTRNRWDYFCLACALLTASIYVLYRYSGIFLGPRYWFEAAPFLLLLTARGAEMAGLRLGEAVSSLRTRLSGVYWRPAHAGYVPAYAVLIVLMLLGSGGWLLNKNDPQDSALVPYEVNAMKGIFDTDDRLRVLADDTDLDNALVLVRPCGYFVSAHCYGSVFIRNDVIPRHGDVVWMRYEEGRIADAVQAFPGRRVYIANWDPEASLEPYDPQVHR